MPSKVCTKCRVEKSLDEFPLIKKTGIYENRCRACKIQYLREYRVKNRDRLIEFDRARYAANPEFKRGLAREWAKNNRERHSENTNRWYHENHEKARAINARWEKENRDKCIAKFQRRRARLLGVGGSYTADEWQLLKKLCGYRCLCCERQEPNILLTLDHVVPVSRGGRNVISNAQPLCRVCNSSKGTKEIDYRNAEIKAACQLLFTIEDSDREDTGKACYVAAPTSSPETIRAC